MGTCTHSSSFLEALGLFSTDFFTADSSSLTVGSLTTSWCNAALGTVVKTFAWGLFLRDHPWNIVRDCLFSFVSVFSSNPRYRAPLSAT